MTIPQKLKPQDIIFKNATHLVLNDTIDLKIAIDDNGNYTIYILENYCADVDVKYANYLEFYNLKDEDDPIE